MRSTGKAQASSGLARGSEIGSLISATFGFVFVLVNSGQLAGPLRIALLVLSGLALTAVLVLIVRMYRSRQGTQAVPSAPKSPFGRQYWIILAIEVVALFAGTRLLTTTLEAPELGVAWVSVVVGVHFFALARVFGLNRFNVLATIVTVLGLAGFGLAAVDQDGTIAFVSGVLPGLVFLGFALWAMTLAGKTQV